MMKRAKIEFLSSGNMLFGEFHVAIKKQL